MSTNQILNLASSFCNMIDDQNEVTLTLEQEVL